MTTARLSALLALLTVSCNPVPADRHELTLVALQEVGEAVVYDVSLTVSEINPTILMAFASMIPERLDVEIDLSASRNETLMIDYTTGAGDSGVYALDDARYATISDARDHAFKWLKAVYDIP